MHAARRRQAARGPSGSLLVASQREPLGESLLLVGESRRRALDLKKLNNGFADELSQWLPVMALLSSARFLQTSIPFAPYHGAAALATERDAKW